MSPDRDVDPAPTLVGRQLRHYRVEELLGRGGMGVVYRARDTRLDRPVALKVLSSELAHDALFKRRFLNEARAASAVNHPAIAQIYDVDEDGDVTFIAMEFVEGRTVSDRILARDLDLLRAVDVAIAVAGALDRAHEAGIVHRDIKSENIMVTHDGQAKVLDFGLARLLEPGVSGEPGSSEELTRMETVARTRAGLVLGTVAYMSPEQARGRPADNRSDIFSLGIVLHEMVTGERPFGGDTLLDTMHAIAFEESRPLTQIRSDLPASLQRVVSRCLAKEPAERYASARVLAQDLVDVRREIESGIFRDPPIMERLRERIRALRGQRVSTWLIVLAAFAIVAAAALVWMGRDVPVGQVIFLAIAGLFVYRRFRNRRHRLIKRFGEKVKKMPEVRLIARNGNRVTLFVDRPPAQLYERVNQEIEKINGKLFHGEPFTVAIKESPGREEERGILEGSGIIYVRSDVVEKIAVRPTP